MKNATTTDNTKVVLSYNINAASSYETNITATKKVRLAKGDTLKVCYFQNSGSGVAIVSTVGSGTCDMGNAVSATWVAP